MPVNLKAMSATPRDRVISYAEMLSSSCPQTVPASFPSLAGGPLLPVFPWLSDLPASTNPHLGPFSDFSFLVALHLIS